VLEIRALTYEDMTEALRLKIECWTEELQGVAKNDLDFDSEFLFWTDWMYKAEAHHDIRRLIGAFEDQQLLGVSFASIAEVFDCENAFELNGLWVDPKARKKGIARKLIKDHAIAFKKEDFKEMIVYCHHFAPAHDFYVHLGGKVIREELQMDGILKVDVFKIEIDNLL